MGLSSQRGGKGGLRPQLSATHAPIQSASSLGESVMYEGPSRHASDAFPPAPVAPPLPLHWPEPPRRVVMTPLRTRRMRLDELPTKYERGMGHRCFAAA